MGILLWVSSTRLSTAAAETLYRSLQDKADYPLRKDEILAITATLGDIAKITENSWKYPLVRQFVRDSWIVTLPTTLYFLSLTIRQLSSGGALHLVRIAAVMVPIAPLSLHFVAWDFQRWTTLATIARFLSFATVVLYQGLVRNNVQEDAAYSPSLAAMLFETSVSG